MLLEKFFQKSRKSTQSRTPQNRTMKSKKRLIRFVAAAAAALAAASTHAATITWTAHNITAGNGTADVSLAGTVLEARNGATSDALVNGVTFKSRANILLQSTIYGEATYGNLFDSIFANDNITSRRGTYPTNTGGSNYSGFLSVGQRSGRPASSGGALPQVPSTQVWATVNLSNLTIGNTYQIQIWAVDTNTTVGDAGNKGLLLGNGAAGNPVLGTDTMLLYEFADGAAAGVYGAGGQYGLGTFVANATTQSFNVRTYNNLLTPTPSAASQDHFSNGWQLRDLGVVPEPSAALLGGLGLLALLRRRRS
jgi:MYXO-CTERM domain-containing protein